MFSLSFRFDFLARLRNNLFVHLLASRMDFRTNLGEEVGDGDKRLFGLG
jgi:hypothetical protein